MPLVVLDRDGVINEDSPNYIRSAEEWIPIPGSLEAIGRLTREGWIVAVATNQSGIGRGYYDERTLAAIHAKMEDAVADHGGRIELIAHCPHAPEVGCTCRKPEPGLLRRISTRLAVPLTRVPVIGDAPRDLEAARRVGARPILVLTGKGRETLQGGVEGVEVFENLHAAVDVLCAGGTNAV